VEWLQRWWWTLVSL